jgi:hypothetical protein
MAMKITLPTAIRRTIERLEGGCSWVFETFWTMGESP